MSWFRSEFSQWGVPVRRASQAIHPSLPQLNSRTRALFGLHLKRGIRSGCRALLQRIGVLEFVDHDVTEALRQRPPHLLLVVPKQVARGVK
jgi:hypothetical protein